MALPTAVPPSPEPDDGPGAGALGFDISGLLPARSAADILAGEIRFTLGRREPIEYTLQVLSIAANRRWKEGLEGSIAQLLNAVDGMGDDLGEIMQAFATITPQLLDALYTYDVDHVLPERDALEEVAGDAEVLRAVLEVWSAANPFARVAIALVRGAGEEVAQAAPTLEVLTNDSSTPTSSAPPSTGGRRKTSKRA